jgi:cold shock CspA family protein
MILEVTFYNASKGHGFLRCIEPGKPRFDCFVHTSCIAGQINLQAGDLVTADVIPSKSRPGRLDAVNVVLRKRDDVAKAGI